MSEKFTTEKDGQIDFYNQFLPIINPTITVDEIIANNNDGILNGNLIEFKLTVKDLNEVLFQCIKHLSALRIKETPVPANIVIVDLNSTKAYLYKSENYLDSIEKVLTVEHQKIMRDLLAENQNKSLITKMQKKPKI